MKATQQSNLTESQSQPEPQPTKTLPNGEDKQAVAQKFECAIALILPQDGGSCIADLAATPTGAIFNRKATLDDLYRMVCDVKSQIESMRSVNYHFSKMREITLAAQQEKLKQQLRNQ